MIVTNLKYSSADHSILSLDVVDDWTNGEVVPMCIHADYETEFGRFLYAEAVSGRLGQIAEYVAEEIQDAISSCTAWQIRKALNQLGLRQAVESAVAASTDQEIKDGWEFATQFLSDHPFVIAIGQALGKTPEEIKQIITMASAL